ncbi:glycosyl hydrolase 2 galactose-binding domain-containing protein [Methylobacterium sp. J-076]|uniref:glycosyl hydrolase 2 galactose-binding domain-containing protein n=1 Tax=Methylobacterium sp. J-076 TaxID=2836655 RepID=UPI001FBAEA94|nr:glycoside hydrolase family 2 protein [Methylobacterium sp. J-076]MCJ2015487.1 glycoside hydrolase family 2 protein [Methylobacterium sp. J-076]
MARIRTIDGAPPRAVAGPWRLLATPAGSCAGPGDLDGRDGWIPAPVPGTAARAMSDAGLWREDEPAPIHDRDIWYRAPIPGAGRERLRFEGLATLAEIWLDGVPVIATDSMFRPWTFEAELTGNSELVLCFRSLAAALAKPHKRGRWRPRLATPGSLRHARTSLLGFMPGWSPVIDHVGPFRPVTREQAGAGPFEADLRASLDGTTGRLVARLRLPGLGGRAVLRCDGREASLAEEEPGLFVGEVALPGIAPWWPHSHGEPRLHGVEADIGGRRLDLGRVGFRSIATTRPFAEGLSLSVNGVPVFCRGAVWTPADLVGLSGHADSLRPLLDLAREAGVNMLRVPGITLYESDAFHDLCDEYGIMVWQDLMLANFDYPHDDPAFRGSLAAEIASFLDRAQTSPSLCVLCGGSEVWQQAAMLGLPREAWSGGFPAEGLPGLAAEARPDLIVVPNSPSGGDLPFSVRAGVTHYFGVGAYLRPFEDARRAEVGFASECLAFANVPEPRSLRRAGLTDPADPRWAAGIPRDRGADWDFETVRDHYVATLFGADPARLRTDDPERYLALGRAAVAEAMEATFAEWRRARSPTAGGLVLSWRDLAPGAGWGVIAHDGVPKSAWYALKRAFRPVQILLSDEGLDGLHVHALNETPRAVEATLRLAFLDAAGTPVAKAERPVTLAPRTSLSWSSADLLGRFYDAAVAYRFGPAQHRLAHAVLLDGAGEPIADAFQFPAGWDVTPGPTGLSADLLQGPGGWTLRVSAARPALSVQIDLEGEGRPAENGFHLVPGLPRTVPLLGGDGRPRGTARALNDDGSVRF